MTRARLMVFLVVGLGLVWLPGQVVGQLSQVMAKLAVSTIGTEPQRLTAAEIEKVVTQRPPAAELLPVPAGPKPPDESTIEIGPPGLNAVELAKAREIGAIGAQTKASAPAVVKATDKEQ